MVTDGSALPARIVPESFGTRMSLDGSDAGIIRAVAALFVVVALEEGQSHCSNGVERKRTAGSDCYS